MIDVVSHNQLFPKLLHQVNSLHLRIRFIIALYHLQLLQALQKLNVFYFVIQEFVLIFNSHNSKESLWYICHKIVVNQLIWFLVYFCTLFIGNQRDWWFLSARNRWLSKKIIVRFILLEIKKTRLPTWQLIKRRRLTVVPRAILLILGIQPISYHTSPFLVLSVHSLPISLCYVSLRLNLYLWLNATGRMLLAF